MIAIDCTAVEKEVADKMHERSEPDYLIYGENSLPLFSFLQTALNAKPICVPCCRKICYRKRFEKALRFNKTETFHEHFTNNRPLEYAHIDTGCGLHPS